MFDSDLSKRSFHCNKNIIATELLSEAATGGVLRNFQEYFFEGHLRLTASLLYSLKNFIALIHYFS